MKLEITTESTDGHTTRYLVKIYGDRETLLAEGSVAAIGPDKHADRMAQAANYAIAMLEQYSKDAKLELIRLGIIS